ncbi:MAG: phosphate ABC transporter permease subunit PstC [Halobacteriaceae archaeon]
MFQRYVPRWLTVLRRRVGDLDRDAAATAAIGGSSLVAALLCPLVVDAGYVVVPFATFLLAAGYGWVRHRSATAHALAFVATVSTLLVLGLVVVFLFQRAAPAFEEHGVALLTSSSGRLWSPGTGELSLLPAMVGTLMLTVVAVLVAAPLGVAGALFVNEVAPDRIRGLVKPGIEVLAGIPSIVYGFLGFTVLSNFFRDAMLDPVKGSFLLAGLVVGVMALPTVVSVAEDALDSVPDATKDGSVAVGATDWQTMKSVSLPAALSGVSAGVLLGVGRAVGETMAAAAILGSSYEFPMPFFDAYDEGQTLTTLIANFYGNASEGGLEGLFAAGVVLFVVVSALSVTSQVVERRMADRLGGER